MDTDTQRTTLRRNAIITLMPNKIMNVDTSCDIRTPTSPKPNPSYNNSNNSVCINNVGNTGEIPTIHPFFFKDLNVRLVIKDESLVSLVTKNLHNLGAKILSSNQQIPDVIIVDQQPGTIKIAETKQKIKSFGFSRRATKIPKVLSCYQIPWSIANSKQIDININNNNNNNISTKNSTDSNTIVIVDSKHHYRPIQGTFKFQSLDLKLVPKSYLFSPFTPVPENPFLIADANDSQKKNAAKRTLDNSGPFEPGYCEICGKSFDNAAEHRRSSMHIEKTHQPDLFLELDSMIKNINFL